MNNFWRQKIPSKPLLLPGTLAEMLMRTWERPRPRHPFSEFLLGPVEGKGQCKFQQTAAGIIQENMFIRSLGHHHNHQDLPNALQVKLKSEQSNFKTLLLCILSLFQSFWWIYTSLPPSFQFWAFTFFREAEEKRYYPMHQYIPGKVKITKGLWKPGNQPYNLKKYKCLCPGSLLFPVGTLL